MRLGNAFNQLVGLLFRERFALAHKHHDAFLGENDVLDFVGGGESLPAQLPVHLLLGHLPLDQAAIEDQELIMVLDKLKCHLVVEL